MRILVTAGPTREFFDTVRFISNPSSGKMGYALAEAAVRRGHDVVLVSGPVALEPPKGARLIRVVTAAQMAAACKKVWPSCDAAMMTAAVCDYRPKVRLDHKLAKTRAARHVTLVPTEDIASTLGRRKNSRVLVGFAQEDHDHRAHAEAKLRRKRCDAIVLNGPENVGSDRATVEILTADGAWSAPLAGSKRRVAEHVVGLVERLAGARGRPVRSGRTAAGRPRRSPVR